MASQSKGAKKRDHIPNMNNNNPLLVTPKPPSKKDKKEQEQEAMQNYTLSTPSQMISVRPPPPPTSQFQQRYQLQNFQPYQYQGTFGSVTEEIGSIKSILTSMMYKLDKLEPMEKSIKEMSTSITFINNSVEEMKAENFKLKDQIEKLRDRVIDVQSRTMRNNLIFYNIEETEDYQNKENIVSSEKILVAFLKDKLNYKDEIILERAHRIRRSRIGPNGRHTSRPLVAKFLSYKQKEEIRKKYILA